MTSTKHSDLPCEATLRMHALDTKGSVCDGPGIRTVLYMQGCTRQCKGCHNKATWPHNEGKQILVSELAEQIRRLTPNKRLTISGGEPMEQVNAVRALLRELSNFEVALYTGMDAEEIPKDIIELIRYIKVGPYDEKSRTTMIPFIGSSNQRFLSTANLKTVYGLGP